MTYVGDFPPCQHEFHNSNGIILCKHCGAVPQANSKRTYGKASNG